MYIYIYIYTYVLYIYIYIYLFICLFIYFCIEDRTWKGTDHAASLEPAGLGRLTRDLKASLDKASCVQ